MSLFKTSNKQGRQKEYKIGPTILKKPQSDNYWSDQNSENMKSLTINDKMFGPTKVGVVGPVPPALISMILLCR